MILHSRKKTVTKHQINPNSRVFRVLVGVSLFLFVFFPDLSVFCRWFSVFYRGFSWDGSLTFDPDVWLSTGSSDAGHTPGLAGVVVRLPEGRS